MPVAWIDEDPLVDHPRYRKIRQLNRGAFGVVLLAEDKEANEQVAIKFLRRGSRINQNVEREVLNHKNLLHHHVVQFKGVFLTRSYLAIVMEYVPGGDLLNYIQRHGGISEEMARWFFQQLIIGLDYCHRMGVMNRDIKLENTLLTDGRWPLVKICDFGYSKNEMTDSQPHSLVGTRPYLAPEVIFRSSLKETYDGKKDDIWCCGVLLYVMMVGCYPFEHPDDDPRRDANIIRDRIRRLDFEIPNETMSADCEDLIRTILVTDPEDRASIQDIQSHQWYAKDLPEGALKMNNKRQCQTDLQNETEIKTLFEEARVVIEERKNTEHFSRSVDNH